jgi:hypothetical protein
MQNFRKRQAWIFLPAAFHAQPQNLSGSGIAQRGKFYPNFPDELPIWRRSWSILV